MRLILISAALVTGALSLSACNKGSGDQEASDRAVQEAGGSVPTMQRTPDEAATTGAAGATTGTNDPNPAGQGATTDATPGDATGSLNSTPTQPPPTTPPSPK